MNKKTIKKISALITSSIMLCGISTVFATDANQNTQDAPTAQTTQGTVQFVSEYDTTISPQSGDVFIITYGFENNTAQMEIDASIVSSTPREITMPIATFSIFDIEAKSGTRNENIAYAVNNQFDVSLDHTSEIKIYIGEETVNNAISLFGKHNLVVKNYTVTSPTPSFEPSIELPSETPSEYSSELPSENPTEPSDWGLEPSVPQNIGGEIIEESNNPSQDEGNNEEHKPSEKTEEEIAAEKEAHKKSIINRGIFFLVISCGCLAGLFIGHKMGKF